jgi:hypothetical protein
MIRNSQIVVEVLSSGEGAVRLRQIYVELLGKGTSHARTYQQVVEVLSRGEGAVRNRQMYLEALTEV